MLGNTEVKLQIKGSPKPLNIGEYEDYLKCLKLNFKTEEMCKIHCVSCGGELVYGISDNFPEICVCCFDLVFVDKSHGLMQKLQIALKFNQYCGTGQQEEAFAFFVDMVDYLTNFIFRHKRNLVQSHP